MSNISRIQENEVYWNRVWDSYEAKCVELKITETTLKKLEQEGGSSQYLEDKWFELRKTVQWYYDLIQKETERKAG
jgi:ribosomal protein L28